MLKTSDAIVKIKSSKSDGSGRVCAFYKISENSGAKVYRTMEVAYQNINSQRELHKLGFAPEVLSDVIMFKDDETPKYMFLTELAKTVAEVCIEDGLACNNCINNGFCDCYQSDISYNWVDLEQFQDILGIQDRMHELGLSDTDNHWGNYGYLSDGTPVVIDCEFYHLYK